MSIDPAEINATGGKPEDMFEEPEIIVEIRQRFSKGTGYHVLRALSGTATPREVEITKRMVKE